MRLEDIIKNARQAVLVDQTSGSNSGNKTNATSETANKGNNTIQNAFQTAKTNLANNTPVTPDMTNLPKDTTTPPVGTLGSVVGTVLLPNYKGSGGSGSGSSSASGAVSDYQGMLDDLYNKVMGYESYKPSTFTPSYYTPSVYQSTVDTSGTEAMLEAALNDIRGYGDFQYDLNSDMLYQNMVDNYTMLGKQAMQDAMGQAAALTGGYGNSYAASVGNQAYQQFLTQVNNQIPQFQQAALNVWQSGYDRLLNDYNAVSQQLANLLALEDRNFNIWSANESNAANAFKMNESNLYNAWAQNEKNAYNSWLAGYNQLKDQYKLGVDYIGQLQALQKSSGSGGGSSTSNKTQSTNDKIVSAILGGNSNLNPNNGIVGGALISNPSTSQAYLDYLAELEKLNKR